MLNKITILFCLIFICSCKGNNSEVHSLFNKCQNESSFRLQLYKAPINLFQINLPQKWYKEVDFDGKYISMFAIDTTNKNEINTIGINVKKTNLFLEGFFSSELSGMKKDFPIIKTGGNLLSDNDRWVINKEIIDRIEVVNLFVYTIFKEKAYTIHVTSSISDNYLNDLCKFVPLLQSFSIHPASEINSTTTLRI